MAADLSKEFCLIIADNLKRPQRILLKFLGITPFIATGLNTVLCKSEEQPIARLDQAILGLINNPKKNSTNYRFRNLILTNALAASEIV